MDGRLVLAGLTAALTTPALAQNTPAAPMPFATVAANQPAGLAMNTALGDAEAKHLGDTITAGTVALETSRAALEKARDADVKQYAKVEKDEQEGLAEVLKSLVALPGTAR